MGNALFWLPVAVVLLASCSQGTMVEGQRQPVVSPDGEFLLSVPIEESELPELAGAPVWMVTISHVEGGLVHQDRMSKLAAQHNVYWAWGPEGRVWLYNSDDGAVWFWENRGDWEKHLWGYGRERAIDYDIWPPEAIYPDYVQ